MNSGQTDVIRDLAIGREVFRRRESITFGPAVLGRANQCSRTVVLCSEIQPPDEAQPRGEQ